MVALVEGQQQVLRATFPGIRDSVCELLGVRADALARRFVRTHDMKVKEEIPSHHLDTMAKKPWPLAWLKRHTGWAILAHPCFVNV
jgi:hypothetical protein